MWKRTFTLLALLTAFAATDSAEIHKWTDAEGNVHFGDRPPKSMASETVTLNINSYQSVTIEPFEPFVSAPRRGGNSVVLYSTEWCGVCNRAKRYLKENNIPFQEYDVENSEKGPHRLRQSQRQRRAYYPGWGKTHERIFGKEI
jgi:hypothetical protein